MSKLPAISLLSVQDRSDILRSYSGKATHIRVIPNRGKQSITIEAVRDKQAIARQEILNVYIPHTISSHECLYDLTTFAYGVSLITVDKQPALYFGIMEGAAPTSDDRQYIYFASLTGADNYDGTQDLYITDDITSCVELYACIADLSDVYKKEEDDE